MKFRNLALLMIPTALVLSGSGCPSDGTPAPVAGGPLDVTQTGGHWTGLWTDTTLGVSGPATMDVAFDTAAHTGSMTLDAGPNLFGEGDPPADTFNGPYTPTGVTFDGVSQKFGNVHASVTSSTGIVDGTSNNVNSAIVDSFTFHGPATPTQMQLSMNVHLRNGSTHVGTLTLHKQ